MYTSKQKKLLAHAKQCDRWALQLDLGRHFSGDEVRAIVRRVEKRKRAQFQREK